MRDVPDVYGRSRIGWSILPEKLQRDHRDLTIADVLRIQHLLGQKPHESGRALRTVLAGVAVDPRLYAEIPRLVIGGGLDKVVEEPTSERVATWLGTPTPIVSPKQTSSTPRSIRRSATSTARPGSTRPV